MTARLHRTLTGRIAHLRRHSEDGLATAEYAVATVAAVGFAGLLIVLLTSDEVRGMLLSIIQSALTL